MGREPHKIVHMQKVKYNKLEKLVKASGWTVVPLYVEVGSRGIINDIWGRMCKVLCMKEVQNKTLRQHCSRIALRCSYFIYLSRKQKEWVAHNLVED